MIYLYGAVDDAESARSTLPAGERFEVLSAGPVPCLAQIRADAELVADTSDLLSHDRIVQHAMRACTVVPFRFGTTVRDEDDFHRQLDDRAEELEALLRRLRGKREWALRARPRSVDPPRPARSGRDYLRGLMASQPAIEARELHQLLAGKAVDSVVELNGAGGLKAAYLVPVEEVEDFARTVDERRQTMTDLAVTLTGPWAPYSFVQRPGWGSGYG